MTVASCLMHSGHHVLCWQDCRMVGCAQGDTWKSRCTRHMHQSATAMCHCCSNNDPGNVLRATQVSNVFQVGPGIMIVRWFCGFWPKNTYYQRILIAIVTHCISCQCGGYVTHCISCQCGGYVTISKSSLT